MKTPYPDRDTDRWEHALLRPVTRRTRFELLELIRADLFDYLDFLTTNYDPTPRDRAWSDREFNRTFDRLKELKNLRPEALEKAFKAGRVGYAYPHGKETPGPSYAPFQR